MYKVENPEQMGWQKDSKQMAKGLHPFASLLKSHPSTIHSRFSTQVNMIEPKQQPDNKILEQQKIFKPSFFMPRTPPPDAHTRAVIPGNITF